MKKDFYFDNKADNLFPVLQEMMSHIRTLTADQKVTGRCTVILTELLTNAIKHAGVAPTRITMLHDGARLSMEKYDHGQQFLPEYIGASENTTPNQKIVISADPMSDLFVIREDDHKLRFGVQDHPLTETVQVDQLVEHFGLLLITQASDEFYYEYQDSAGINLFRSTITL